MKLENWLDLPFDFKALSCDPSININDVIQFPEKPWDYNALSCNPSIL